MPGSWPHRLLNRFQSLHTEFGQVFQYCHGRKTAQIYTFFRGQSLYKPYNSLGALYAACAHKCGEHALHDAKMQTRQIPVVFQHEANQLREASVKWKWDCPALVGTLTLPSEVFPYAQKSSAVFT